MKLWNNVSTLQMTNAQLLTFWSIVNLILKIIWLHWKVKLIYVWLINCFILINKFDQLFNNTLPYFISGKNSCFLCKKYLKKVKL